MINKWMNVKTLKAANEAMISHENFDGFDHDLYELFYLTENGQWEITYETTCLAAICPYCGEHKYDEDDECVCGDTVHYISTHDLMFKLVSESLNGNTVCMRKKWQTDKFTVSQEYTYMGLDYLDWYKFDNL